MGQSPHRSRTLYHLEAMWSRLRLLANAAGRVEDLSAKLPLASRDLLATALAAVRFPSAALDEREPARASDLLKVAIRYPNSALKCCLSS